MQPIPVTILAGFLGAGKTTLLNYILKADHGLRVAVLVNDFGAINIDVQLVTDIEEDMINLANGCICCTIRDDLKQSILTLLARDPLPEYIIIETSGVSEPIEVARTFTLPALAAQVRVDSILTVVDTEQLSTLKGENAVLAMDQIGVADMIILNKIDLVTPDIVDQVKHEWIWEVTPHARILEANHCQVPFALILGVGHFAPEKLHGHHHDHQHDQVFSTWSWESDEALDFKMLQKTINNLPTSVFRLKGFVNLADEPQRRGIIQVVGQRANLEIGTAWGTDAPHTQLVAIGTDFKPVELTQQFEQCIAQPSSLERLKVNVMSWLRGEHE